MADVPTRAAAGAGLTAAGEQLRILHIFWISFLAAVAVYVPVPVLIGAEGGEYGAVVPDAVRASMHSAALGAAVASFLARRWWTNSLLAALRRAPGPAVRVDPWIRLRAGCLITWFLSDAVAIIGLLLAILTHRPLAGVPFSLGAALLLYLHRPAVWPLDALLHPEGAPT